MLIFRMSSICWVALSLVFPAHIQAECRRSSEPSLFEGLSHWKTTANQTVTLSEVKGSWALISMVYTSCAHSCPMTIAKMQKIEKILTQKAESDPDKAISSASGISLKMVLASFDREGDTPIKLKKFQKSRGLDPANWVLLSPVKEEDARELAVLLGVNYRAIRKGEFTHSNVIALLDPDGHVVARLDHLSASVEGWPELQRQALSNQKCESKE